MTHLRASFTLSGYLPVNVDIDQTALRDDLTTLFRFIIVFVAFLALLALLVTLVFTGFVAACRTGFAVLNIAIGIATIPAVAALEIFIFIIAMPLE